MDYNLFTPSLYEQATQQSTVSLEGNAISSSIDATANGKLLDHKKQNGVFYTRGASTRLLADWAIRRASDLVLEPSFGGCGFLGAALDRFAALNTAYAANQLYGCDIDPKAFEHLNDFLPPAADNAHFIKGDFLSIDLKDFGISGVDAIIGNPPYVSWHTMLLSQRDAASKITTPSGGTLKKKGSLWAFFVIHSLNFLKPGGRMAWILPSGFLHSDYATPLRNIVAACFSKTLAVALEERLFLEEGTEESSVILLCEGYQTEKSELMRLTSAKDLNQLAGIIKRWTVGEELGNVWNQQASLLLAPPHIVQCYQKLKSQESYRALSQLLKVRIGLVTGDNKFFVLNKAQAASAELPESALKPIIARLVHFKGLDVFKEDLTRLTESGERCLLLDITGQNIVQPVRDYLSTYPENPRLANYTFGKRPVWYQVDDGFKPDAFFSCMSSQGPTLALNTAGTTCTNTVYRVWFSNKTSLARKHQIALSLQSTFSQFSAEVVGRSHGSSALKLEPSEVLQLGLLLPPTEVDPTATYEEVNAQLRLGNLEAARRAADAFLISQGLLTQEDAETLEAGLISLRAIRQRKR